LWALFYDLTPLWSAEAVEEDAFIFVVQETPFRAGVATFVAGVATFLAGVATFVAGETTEEDWVFDLGHAQSD
jgi:hypothetical protein